MGGSDPFIVLESADLEVAVETAVTARMLNNGQSCIAAKRFILHEAIAAEFTEKLLAKFKDLQVGDPIQENTDIGPLATPSILTELDQLVQACANKGAKILIGGQPITDKPGNFYPPTLITAIPPWYDRRHRRVFWPSGISISG